MGSIEWRDVPGMRGAYSVSSDGRVRSNPHVVVMKNGARKTVSGRELRPGKVGAGYLRVGLLNKNPAYVHSLVARAFLGDPGEGYEVNHKDENKLNNSADNLEWVTHKQNCSYGTRNERSGSPARPVIAKLDGETVYSFASMMDAERAGFSRHGIRRCCEGEANAYRGLVWEWENYYG